MFRKRLSLLIVFTFLAGFWAFPAYALIVEGPVLDQPESGWEDFGLLIRAEADVVLVSVRFPNQGLADTIELRRHSDGALLASIPTPAGNTDITVDIHYPLTASETYRLVATTPDNRFFGFLDGDYTAGNPEITVLSSYGQGITTSLYWFSFNTITTQTKSVEILQAVVDIKPGNNPNSINLKSKGVVPVAILTTESLDAQDIDPESILFAGAFPIRWKIEDVDDDGDNDMLLHFSTQDLADLNEASTVAVLTGSMLDGTSFEGSDTVKIVPKCK